MTNDPLQTQTIDVSTANAGAAIPAMPRAMVTARVSRKPRQLNARYELAERSVDMNEQFARAGGGSALMNQSGADRSTMRDRIRHEMFEADPWLHGSQRTTTVSVVGRGPWLEVKIPGNPKASKTIADKFNQWFRKRVLGPRNMRTMCWEKGSAGAGLALVVYNPKIRGKVKLDFVPFEDDQIKRPLNDKALADRRTYLLDGIDFDAFNKPERYWICERHPDEYPEETPRPVAAEFVIDVFEKLRPSQGRGVSAYATGTRNGPLRRSYRRATLDAALTAAKLSYLLKTNVDRFENGDEKFEDIDSLTGIPIYYGEGQALPKGWEPQQLKPEQPTTGHNEFMLDNVAEQGRAAGQPRLVSTGDATGANFAAGQLSRADWGEDVDVRRQDWEDLCLDKLLEHWLVEAALVGEIPMEYRDIDEVPHEYRWSRRRHQDTNKEYSGRAKAIETGQTSRAHWQTDDGLNPDTEDQAAADGFGVTLAQYRQALFLKNFGDAALIALGVKKPGEDPPPDDESNELDDGAENETDDDSQTVDAAHVERERVNGTNRIRSGNGAAQYNR